MRYLWTEDIGAGLHFWKLMNQLIFDSEFVVESKGSNQGILDALSEAEISDSDMYYIAFDYVVDNQDIRNKYRVLKSIASRSEGKIVILDMICFVCCRCLTLFTMGRSFFDGRKTLTGEDKCRIIGGRLMERSVSIYGSVCKSG